MTSSNIRLKPNPATTRISIELEVGELEGNPILNIYSLDGRIIKSTSLVNNDNKVVENLDISNYPLGMYIVEIVTSSRIYREKFTKN